MNLFTDRFYSYELGVRKPEPQIYRLALTRAGLTPEETLLIDDRLENIVGARAVGMQTLHFPAPEGIELRLADMLADVDRDVVLGLETNPL
jgi:putative hydrolase of the HAD superfamily